MLLLLDFWDMGTMTSYCPKCAMRVQWQAIAQHMQIECYKDRFIIHANLDGFRGFWLKAFLQEELA